MLLNRATPGLACVVADFDTGTQQIVAHLASHGHRAFVFLGGAGRVVVRGPALERPAGRGPPAGPGGHPLRALHTDPGLGRRRRRRRGRGPGERRGGPQRHAGHRRAGAAGPARGGRARRVSVVGFDDIFGADFCQPPLTTLAEPTEEAGTRAVEALVLQARSPAAGESRCACCRRSSSCAPPAAPPPPDRGHPRPRHTPTGTPARPSTPSRHSRTRQHCPRALGQHADRALPHAERALPHASARRPGGRHDPRTRAGASVRPWRPRRPPGRPSRHGSAGATASPGSPCRPGRPCRTSRPWRPGCP